MTQSNDELWWASLDDELDAAESVALDQSLTEEQRRNLSDEREFEGVLSKVLGEHEACPARAWNRALGEIRRSAYPGRKRFVRAAGFALALAAVFLIVTPLVAYYYRTPAARAWFLVLSEPDAKTLAARAHVADGVKNVRAFLLDHSVKIALDPANVLDRENSEYALLGACQNDYNGEPVVELLFSSSFGLAKIAMMSKGGAAAREAGAAAASGAVRATRLIGDLLIVLVGENAPGDLMKLVDDPMAATAGPSDPMAIDATEATRNSGMPAPGPSEPAAPSMGDVVPDVPVSPPSSTSVGTDGGYT